MSDTRDRPRLAYVAHALNPGGTERLVIDMAIAFSSRFRVAVFCLDEPGAWAATLRSAGIPVHALWRQPGLDLSMAGRLATHLREFGADIVHAHQCSAWFYSALARLRHPAPRLVFEEHGRFYPEIDHPRRRFVNRILIRRLTHRFVAVSEDIRARLVRYEGLDAGQIEVVYNGVAPVPAFEPEARAQLRARLGLGADDFVVGTVGRFDPIKNLPMLVSAFEKVAKAQPRLRLLLVGDGPERTAIARRIDEAGLGGRAILTGHRDDARQLAQCLDLFVLASFSEGTSMALLEAMAAAVPVAVTRVGGNPEIVVDGQTGWVVPSDDVEALAAVLHQALARPDQGRKYGEAGRRRFEQRFTFAGMIEAYRSIYAGLATPADRLALGAGA
ncbi:MAG: glycosyltransferase [Burkholderiaceae bacterium]|nr:glycosyltransferase [Burkholderiaceae bacterium]